MIDYKSYLIHKRKEFIDERIKKAFLKFPERLY